MRIADQPVAKRTLNNTTGSLWCVAIGTNIQNWYPVSLGNVRVFPGISGVLSAVRKWHSHSGHKEK